MARYPEVSTFIMVDLSNQESRTIYNEMQLWSGALINELDTKQIYEIFADLYYYHTNNQFILTNKGPGFFKQGENIIGATAGTGTVNSDSAIEVDPFSGELLYIDSRARIIRSADQTEDIKVILTV